MLTKPLYACAAVFYCLVAEANTRHLSSPLKTWHGNIMMDTLMTSLSAYLRTNVHSTLRGAGGLRVNRGYTTLFSQGGSYQQPLLPAAVGPSGGL